MHVLPVLFLATSHFGSISVGIRCPILLRLGIPVSSAHQSCHLNGDIGIADPTPGDQNNEFYRDDTWEGTGAHVISAGSVFPTF